MFKRREPKTYLRLLTDLVYPKGGWGRAASYVMHRLRRLPDPPQRIARGVAAGIFVSFTPFFGMHFLLAAILSWVLQGNLLAALLATFIGNPLTFPFIAASSLEIGWWILGHDMAIPMHEVFGAFKEASLQIWSNFWSMFTHEPAHWDQMGRFFRRVFLPYLIGGIGPGILLGAVGYMLSRPMVAAYQSARIRRLKERFQKRRAAAAQKG